MANPDDLSDKARLQRLARQEMVNRGLEPDFSPAAMAELARITGPAVAPAGAGRDLRNLLWCSIDNDDSRDLDQLTVAAEMPDGAVKAIRSRGKADFDIDLIAMDDAKTFELLRSGKALAIFQLDSLASAPPVVKKTRLSSPGARWARRSASSTALGWA